MSSKLTLEEFWWAVSMHDYETVRKAIADGFDIHAKIPGKHDPLIVYATPGEDMVMLKLLWEAGAVAPSPWLEAVFADFAGGGDGSKLKTKRQKKPVGKFILHRFNGDEEFALEDALIRIEREDERASIYLEARTNGTVIKSLPDTEGLNGMPNAEITLTLDADETADLIGKVLRVDEGYDEEAGDYLALIYYVEHEVLDANKVEFVSRKKNKYFIRWRGTTIDVNYYDGSKPDTRVEIEGRLTLEAAD